jgi:cell division protease FtsH
MVRDYGMSSLGPVALGDERQSVFLKSAGVGETRSYSETTARLVDEEVRKMVGEALERARQTLREHKDKVQALAARLLSTEVVDEDELARILGPKVSARDMFHPDAAQELSAHPVGGEEAALPPTARHSASVSDV